MKNHKHLFFLSPILWTFASCLISCHPTMETDSAFYIPVEHSKLYVRIAGNPDKTLIIDLHGGPGAFAGFDHQFFGTCLEGDYLMVYLDQRGGGKSDACPDTNMLTMEQFVKDLDVVVDTLRHRYPGKTINLLGTSWGGTYGLLYLMAHQEKINALVCVSGKASSRYENMALIRHEQELAEKLLKQAGTDPEKQRYRDILAKLDKITHGDFDHFFDDMNLLKHTFPEELGFNPYWANKKAQAEVAALAKDSALYRNAHYTKAGFDSALKKMEHVNRVFRNTPAYNHLNITQEMAVIKTPVCVIQGVYDYVVGVKQADTIYAALTGVPETKKEIHYIAGAAHNVNIEAPDQFFSIVKSFLKRTAAR